MWLRYGVEKGGNGDAGDPADYDFPVCDVPLGRVCGVASHCIGSFAAMGFEVKTSGIFDGMPAVQRTGLELLKQTALAAGELTPDMVRGALVSALANPLTEGKDVKLLELLGKTMAMYTDRVQVDPGDMAPDDVKVDRAIEALCEVCGKPQAMPMMRSLLGLPPLVAG